MRRFEGKVVLVTGAGSGIGEGTARRFSAEGATVVLVGRHKGSIEAAAKDLPGERTWTRVADVSKYRQVEAAIDSTVKKFGRLEQRDEACRPARAWKVNRAMVAINVTRRNTLEVLEVRPTDEDLESVFGYLVRR